MNSENAELLESAPAAALAEVLLEALRSPHTRGFSFSDEPSAPLQLRALFESASPRGQRTLKEAVVRALADWLQQAHGYPVLRDLAVTSALIVASAAIPTLGHHLRSFTDKWPTANADDEDIAGLLIGVVAGFPRSSESVDALEPLFFHHDWPPKYSAQLFLGLCNADPGRFPRYLPHYLRVLTQYPTLFDATAVLAEFERVVSVATISARFFELDSQSQAILCLLLGQRPDMPWHFDLYPAPSIRIPSRSDVRYPLHLPHPHDIAVYRHIYAAAASRLGTGNMAAFAVHLQRELQTR